jgi:hypothetical protein
VAIAAAPALLGVGLVTAGVRPRHTWRGRTDVWSPPRDATRTQAIHAIRES